MSSRLWIFQHVLVVTRLNLNYRWWDSIGENRYQKKWWEWNQWYIDIYIQQLIALNRIYNIISCSPYQELITQRLFCLYKWWMLICTFFRMWFRRRQSNLRKRTLSKDKTRQNKTIELEEDRKRWIGFEEEAIDKKEIEAKIASKMQIFHILSLLPVHHRWLTHCYRRLFEWWYYHEPTNPTIYTRKYS